MVYSPQEYHEYFIANAARICERKDNVRRSRNPRKFKVQTKYIYQPIQPEGTIRKSCPTCRRWLYLYPGSYTLPCIHCTQELKITSVPASVANKGGIKIEAIV